MHLLRLNYKATAFVFLPELKSLLSILLCPLHQEKAADELQTFLLWAALKSGSANEQPFDSSEHTTAWLLFSLTHCQAYYTCLSSQGNRRIMISIWLLLLLTLIFAGFEIQQWLFFYFIFPCHFAIFLFFFSWKKIIKQKSNYNNKLIKWKPLSLHCLANTLFSFQNKISLSEEFCCRKKCANEIVCNQNIWNCFTIISISIPSEGGWQWGMFVWNEAVAMASMPFLYHVSWRMRLQEAQTVVGRRCLADHLMKPPFPWDPSAVSSTAEKGLISSVGLEHWLQESSAFKRRRRRQ